MFIFLLNPFDIWNCYYFESNLTLAFHIKVLLIKKHVMMFISPLKMKTQLSLIGLFLCFPRISLGWYCQKSVEKGGDFRKRIKRKMFIQRTVCRVGEDLNLELNMSPPAWWTSLRKSNSPLPEEGVGEENKLWMSDLFYSCGWTVNINKGFNQFRTTI